MTLHLKITVCLYVFTVLSFFLGYAHFASLKRHINENSGSVLVGVSGHIKQHDAAFVSHLKDHNSHKTEDCLANKVIKQCFHLSFNANTLKALTKLTVIDLDTEKWIDEYTKHSKTGIVTNTHNTLDSRLCTRFVTMASYNGRLGNQMFEIASMVGLAYMYDAIPVIPSWFPLSKYFNLPNRINTTVYTISNAKMCFPKKSATFYKCSKEFSSQANISLRGYLQSWRYFTNASYFIRETFKFKSKHLTNAKLFLSSVFLDGYIRVCIHIRRTDLLEKGWADAGLVVPSLNFIKKAKTFFKNKYSKIQFIVVTDDKSWCRRKLKGMIISPLTDPGDEMALMTLCDHAIITAGSYGWWGAWLSGGIAVYYNKYIRPGSRLASYLSMTDYFPPTWIGIS